MRTINFKDFTLPLCISHAKVRIIDAREAFADLVYMNINGIAAHDLAFKIYRSDGPTAFSDNEIAIIRKVAESYATPAFLDGLMECLKGGAE